MGRLICGVGLFLLVLGIAAYLAGLKERLAGPGVYIWFLKKNKRATAEQIERVEGQFFSAIHRLCQVGRWMAAVGLVLFLAGYVLMSTV